MYYRLIADSTCDNFRTYESSSFNDIIEMIKKWTFARHYSWRPVVKIINNDGSQSYPKGWEPFKVRVMFKPGRTSSTDKWEIKVDNIGTYLEFDSPPEDSAINNAYLRAYGQ